MGFLRTLTKIGGGIIGGAVGFVAGGFNPITAVLGATAGAAAGSWLGD